MNKRITIAIASGKGGTGKTTIATNMAVVLAEMGTCVAYVDCDVEEPNGHIFLKPSIHASREVAIPVPEVDESKCTLCGACGKACRYSAIVVLPKKVLTFPKLCHGCGGCSIACPENAIREVPRPTGVVKSGVSGLVTFVSGRLNIGDAMAPPVIRAVIDAAPKDGTILLDAPPGTSCPVIEAVKSADVVLLVTEPTPFGLNDLKLAVETVRKLGLPFGVVVNRAGVGDSGVVDYCAREEIPLLLQIPNDREIAKAYSRGELAVSALPAMKPLLFDLYTKLVTLATRVPTERLGLKKPASPEIEHLASRPSETQQLGKRREVAELVVVSGKGGTGKTSITASLVSLAAQVSVVDCDVDAADLHLVLEPSIVHRWPFSGGKIAVVDEKLCTGCGVCAENCRFNAIKINAKNLHRTYTVETVSCDGCGVCVDLCPEKAIEFVTLISGEWFVSDTRHGPMAHARLGIAQANSGKLVSLVRREGKALAESKQLGLLICDGSPGIGCPVIASIAGARLVLVVTEPTMSGLHDMTRVLELTRQFNLKTAICINKADINPELAVQIEEHAALLGVPVLGHIHYDDAVTAAQVKRMPVVEFGDSPAAMEIRELWTRVKILMETPTKTSEDS